MKTAAFATLARTLLSLIPSGAIVAKSLMNPMQATCPGPDRYCLGKAVARRQKAQLPYFSVTNQACRSGPVTGSAVAKTLNATVARRCQRPYKSGLIPYTEEFFRQS